MAASSSPRDGRRGARRVAFVSLVLASAVAAAKLVVGFVTGSVALVSDGVHSLLDAGSTGLTLFAVRLAAKPPDREHPYGHGRAENLTALTQAFVMVGVAALVGWEAIRRLGAGVVFEPPIYVLALVVVILGVDISRAVALRRAARRYSSAALEADSMNFAADVLGSLAVLTGLGAARLGFPAGDPLAAIVVVLLVWGMAGRIGLGAVHVLMDRRPEGGLDERLRSAARGVEGVVAVEDVRLRRSGPDTLADLTVSVGRTHSVERSDEIARAVEDAVAKAAPRTSAQVRVSPSEAGEDVVGRTFAAANRVGLADQVHNVLAIRHPEGLWLMLHAKVPADTPLAEAHRVADELEAELRREISGIARVEIHLEPRESQSLDGRVVSAQRDDLVREVSRIVEACPPIVRCHEVAASATSDGVHLVLHCEAPPTRSIADIHDASLKAEDEIHRRFADVRTVTIHFEPTDPQA